MEAVSASVTSGAHVKGRGARVVLLGFGAINRRVAGLLSTRNSTAVVVGIISRCPDPMDPDIAGAKLISDPSELISLSPDIILEAASREAVREWGKIALRAARRVVISSASAFVDDNFLRALRETASQCGSQLVLSSGALAGVDALSAAGRLGMHEVHHRIVKSPGSWGTAGGFDATLLDSSRPTILFRGSARAAATRFPLNANVAVVSALCGMGLDETVVELVSDPSARDNRHEIRAVGDFGSLSITLQNRPLQSNPKSSELAALALVRLAENEVAEFVQ